MCQENVPWLQWVQNKIWNRIRMWILQKVFRCKFISILPPLCIEITSLIAHSQGLITMCLLCILCYEFDLKKLCRTIYLKLYAKYRYKHTKMCFVKSFNQYKKDSTEEIKSSTYKWNTFFIFSQFLVHVPYTKTLDSKLK